MEPGILIWVVAWLALLLGLVAATLSYLTYSEVKARGKVEDDRWHNVDGRLSGVEGHMATLVKNLPTGPALVATFTAVGPPSSDSVDPVYPTPPDSPRATALPARSRPTRRG